MAKITLPYKYTPREYQKGILRAITAGKKRLVQVWHRRSGKELTDIAGIVAKAMFQRVGSYYYIFPKLTQGRKVLWDGIDKDGVRFLEHFPKELVQGCTRKNRWGGFNNSEMKFKYHNGSVFQIVGSDTYDNTMGSNPVMAIFSEYSLQDPLCWNFFRPILAENEGVAVFNFTPRGENHAYDLYELAKADPENWWCELLTVDDTKVIKPDILEQERREIIRLNGNDALYQQEYHCSFTVPISGAYYAEQISQAYRDGRIGIVPHEVTVSVDTWWDLGLNDRMSIWFVQIIGNEVRVIDYEEGSDKGIVDYIPMIKAKPYVYGRHLAPHDIKVRELSSGKTRQDTARNLGIEFEVAPKCQNVLDGIDAVRNLLPRMWIDKEKCKDGINALKSYRKQYDEKRKTYLNSPYHDWSSNAADAMRTGAYTIDLTTRTEPIGKPKDKYLRRRESNVNPVAGFG